MIIYCSYCKINWATLWTHEDGNEVYEFCPICKSSQHLQDGNDIVAHIKCPFTGTITNTTTGLKYIREVEYKNPVVRIKVGKPKWETNEQREAREDAAIEVYIMTGSRQLFFQKIKKAI